MDSLDRAGEQLIEDCVAGTPRVFSNLAELETLATWLTLVSMIFDHTQANPVIPPSHHSLFYKNRKPLNGSAMWLAGTKVSSTQYELNAWSRTVRIGSSTETGHGYFLTVRIQNLVAQVWIPTDWKTDLTFETVNTDFMNQSWPAPTVPVSWPPPKLLPEADLIKFAERFITNWEL